MKKLISVLTVLTILLHSCKSGQQGDAKKEPILISNKTSDASCVFLTKDHQGLPVISWVEKDSLKNKYFYFSNWDGKQERFGNPISIPIDTNTSIHEEGMPKIAFRGDGTMVAIYETSVPSVKSRWGLSDIQYIMSSDRGKTWTVRKSIQSDSPQSGSRSFADIICLDDGEIAVSWLDTDPIHPDRGRPVKFARTNAGQGFGAAILIDSAACQCCRTAMSTDGKGQVNVVFRDLLPGSVRDISIAVSQNNGVRFNTPTPFSDDHWIIDGCPHNGPSVVFVGDKKYVTWYTGAKRGGVYYGELDGQNNMLMKYQLSAESRFAQLALTPSGERIAAFDVAYEQHGELLKKIMVNRIDGTHFLKRNIATIKKASYPVITTMGKNQFVVAWTDGGKVYYKHENTDAIRNTAVHKADSQVVGSTLKTISSTSPTSKDPVCGMMLTEESESEHIVRNGKTIRFCSASCKNAFLDKAN